MGAHYAFFEMDATDKARRQRLQESSRAEQSKAEPKGRSCAAEASVASAFGAAAKQLGPVDVLVPRLAEPVRRSSVACGAWGCLWHLYFRNH